MLGVRNEQASPVKELAVKKLIALIVGAGLLGLTMGAQFDCFAQGRVPNPDPDIIIVED